jgi:hypothetical protein
MYCNCGYCGDCYHCGYCPYCGRPYGRWVYPIHPWGRPYIPYVPPYKAIPYVPPKPRPRPFLGHSGIVADATQRARELLAA